MQLQVLKSIINAFDTASDDVTRFHLNHVSLRAKDGRVVIEATDGHALSHVEIVDEIANEIRDKKLVVSPDALPALKIIAKACRKIYTVPTRWDDGKLIIGDSKLTTVTVEFPTEEQASVTYPNTIPLWPSIPENACRIGFNVELLARLAKSLHDESGKEGHVVLEIKDKNSPILVSCGEQKGILMPLRI